jgi:MFS family permease
MLTLLRVLFGFAIACLVAGAATVAFIISPADVANLPADAQAERLGNAGVLALLTATHSALFAFPFALLAAAFAELRRVRSWLFYALAGAVISLGGLAAIHLNEVEGQPSILNDYALIAFATVGVLAGLAYWLVAGRCAGGKRRAPAAVVEPAVEPAPEPEPTAQAT